MATSGQFPKDTGDIIFANDINEVRRIPRPIDNIADYVLNRANNGMHVHVTNSVKIPASGLITGDTITVYNPTVTSISIAADNVPALYPAVYQIAASTIRPTSIAPNGLVTFLCVDAGDGVTAARIVVTGAGVS